MKSVLTAFDQASKVTSLQFSSIFSVTAPKKKHYCINIQTEQTSGSLLTMQIAEYWQQAVVMFYFCVYLAEITN